MRNFSDALSATICKGCNDSSRGPSEMDQKVIDYVSIMAQKYKTIWELVQEGMAEQSRIDRELCLAWDGDYSSMFEAYELLQKRSKYSSLRFERFKHHENHWKCFGACIIVALIGDDTGLQLNGYLQTRTWGEIGKYAINQAEKKGVKTIAVKVGKNMLPGLGVLNNIDTVVRFLGCNVECAYCEAKKVQSEKN